YKKPRSLERGFLLPEIQPHWRASGHYGDVRRSRSLVARTGKVAPALVTLNPHVGSLCFHHF
ncbi:hypothetical protein, partial [Aeromonas caviae]|uniref:hypothetical protein n=1 Tax=Aeromonas caviae TaxID=648 RepID=UPI002B4737E7